MTEQYGELPLRGPDAANPLGFLCALGALRVATIVWPQRDVRMHWRRESIGWRPILSASGALDEGDLIENVYKYCRFGIHLDGASPATTPPEPAEAFPHLAINNNTSKIKPDEFTAVALEQRSRSSMKRRTFVDYLAAYGSDAVAEDGTIQDTALRTMSGAGHQHFLGTVLKLTSELESGHLKEALLAPWRYRDPLKNLSMRWDPSDLKQYALQADDPSDDKNRRTGSMLGANRLAAEALPLLSTMPVFRGLKPTLATTGFETGATQPLWLWPVWTLPATPDVVASILTSPLLKKAASQEDESGTARERLRRMGIREIFRSRRISVDYYRNFTPAEAV